MHFERHLAAHFAVVLHSLKQPHLVFGLVIAQEIPNHLKNLSQAAFFFPSMRLWEFYALKDLLFLWCDEDTGFVSDS